MDDLPDDCLTPILVRTANPPAHAGLGTSGRCPLARVCRRWRHLTVASVTELALRERKQPTLRQLALRQRKLPKSQHAPFERGVLADRELGPVLAAAFPNLTQLRLTVNYDFQDLRLLTAATSLSDLRVTLRTVCRHGPVHVRPERLLDCLNDLAAHARTLRGLALQRPRALSFPIIAQLPVLENLSINDCDTLGKQLRNHYICRHSPSSPNGRSLLCISSSHARRLMASDRQVCFTLAHADADIQTIVVSCSHPTKLELSSCEWPSESLTDAGLFCIAENLPQLLSFHLICFRDITDARILEVVSACPRLQEFGIDICQNLSPVSSWQLMSKCCALTRLFSHRPWCCHRLRSEPAAAQLAGLQVVDIHLSEADHADAIKDLAASCRQLQELHILGSGFALDRWLHACSQLPSLEVLRLVAFRLAAIFKLPLSHDWTRTLAGCSQLVNLELGISRLARGQLPKWTTQWRFHAPQRWYSSLVAVRLYATRYLLLVNSCTGLRILHLRLQHCWYGREEETVAMIAELLATCSQLSYLHVAGLSHGGANLLPQGTNNWHHKLNLVWRGWRTGGRLTAVKFMVTFLSSASIMSLHFHELYPLQCRICKQSSIGADGQ